MNNNAQMNVKIIVILINTHQIIYNKMLPDERAWDMIAIPRRHRNNIYNDNAQANKCWKRKHYFVAVVIKGKKYNTTFCIPRVYPYTNTAYKDLKGIGRKEKYFLS